MCERHENYLAWLWSSADVSCLSSLGLPLKPMRHDPPSDTVRLAALKQPFTAALIKIVQMPLSAMPLSAGPAAVAQTAH